MTRIHLQEGGPRELRAGKSNLSPCKDYEAYPPGSHIHAYEGKGDWKQLAWIYQGQTVSSKPDKKVGSVDGGTAVHVIWTFAWLSAISCNISMGKLAKYGLDRQTSVEQTKHEPEVRPESKGGQVPTRPY